MGLFDLSGKVAVVTGASRGLGEAMALGLAEAGADVVVADVIDVAGTVSKVQTFGRKALGLKVDVTKKSDVEAMVKQAVAKFGRIDILVNNAGILRAGPSESLGEDDWDKVMAVNLKGQFLCAQAVGKQMIKQKSGRIINIASIAGMFGSAAIAPYNSSKAGVILLTKTLALEWGKHGINVNAICPGVFATDMTTSFIKDEGFMKNISARVPLGRYAEPRELAGTVVYLASDASSYVTGHALVIDGGWTAGL